MAKNKQTPEQIKHELALQTRRARVAKQRADKEEERAQIAKVEAYAGKMVSASALKGPKNMAKARDSLMEAFEALGGTEGLIRFGKMFPKEFYTQLWAKIIPRESTLDVGENLEELLLELGRPQPPLKRAAGDIIEHMTRLHPEDLVDEDDMKRLN